MEMFSQELRELDRNTVQYVMDEMQAENLLEEKEQALSASLEEIRRLKAMLKEPMNQ